MIDAPEMLRSQRKCGRLQAPGHRIDDNSGCPLLVIHEADDWWVIHAPGVRLTVADSILRCRR